MAQKELLQFVRNLMNLLSKIGLFLTNVIKYILNFLFPINKQFGLMSCAHSFFIFEDYKSKKKLIEISLTLLTYFMFIVIQLDGQFIPQLRLLRSPFFGKIGNIFSKLPIFVSAEIIIIKISIFYLIKKYKSVEKISFIQSVEKLNQQEINKIFKITKLIIISTVVPILSTFF